LTLSRIQTNNDHAIDILQDADTAKWIPWPEAHTNESVADKGFSRKRLSSEVEAAECWRSAVVGRLVREEMA